MESPSLWSIPMPMKKAIPNNAPNYSFLFKKISIFPAKGDSSSLPNEKGLPTAISTIPSPFKSPTIIESPKRAFNQPYSRNQEYLRFLAASKHLCNLVILFGVTENMLKIIMQK
jgi:hypothetical protein